MSCGKKAARPNVVVGAREKAVVHDTVPQFKNDETIIYDNEGSFHFGSNGRPFDTIHLSLTEPDARQKNDTTQYFALDFYRNGKVCQTYKIAVDFNGENKAWLFYEDFFDRSASGKRTDNRFFKLTAGVPACGYGVTNYLFFVNNGTAEMLDTWVTAGEETSYSDAVFFPTFDQNRVVALHSTYTDAEILEDSVRGKNTQKIIYSDSSHYRFTRGGLVKHIVKRGQYRTEIKDYKPQQTEE
jgi:hypothetical protein